MFFKMPKLNTKYLVKDDVFNSYGNIENRNVANQFSIKNVLMCKFRMAS